ncbi:glycosyltransferase [Enterococcus phage EF_KTM]|nr:glycosyltransferase [Enterococcus phage EF_RCK]WVH07319.1 glycosyltransferase [Enterococcus phage EF_TR1]
MPRTHNKISRKKAIETYLEGENPLAIISETIEEHTWTVGFNVEDASSTRNVKAIHTTLVRTLAARCVKRLRNRLKESLLTL